MVATSTECDKVLENVLAFSSAHSSRLDVVYVLSLTATNLTRDEVRVIEPHPLQVNLSVSFQKGRSPSSTVTALEVTSAFNFGS